MKVWNTEVYQIRLTHDQDKGNTVEIAAIKPPVLRHGILRRRDDAVVEERKEALPQAVAEFFTGRPEFKAYIDQVVTNARVMGEAMVEHGLRLVSGGTDNHLMLVDLQPAEITGKEAEKLLEEVGFTVNKNAIPNDPQSPFVTSGIRVGSAAMTTRGFDETEAREIGSLIASAIFGRAEQGKLDAVKDRVDQLMAAHPLYPEL